MMRSVILLLMCGIAGVGAASECHRSSFVVALDIGHTRLSRGATSAYGQPELDFNRRLAEELAGALVAQGFAPPLLINSDGMVGSLKRRAEIANDHQTNLFIAIHHDSVQPRYLKRWLVDGHPQYYCDRFSGYSLFISRRNPAFAASERFGRALGHQLRASGLVPTLHHAEAIPGENRPLLEPDLGLYLYDNLVVLRETTMPALLLEAGVIANREEENRLNDPAYRRREIQAIVDAIEDYCRSPAAPPER